jgi:hypothetical protein
MAELSAEEVHRRWRLVRRIRIVMLCVPGPIIAGTLSIAVPLEDRGVSIVRSLLIGVGCGFAAISFDKGMQAWVRGEDEDGLEDR